RRKTDAAAPREPVCATREPPLRPAEAVVELADQQQQAIVDGVHVAREPTDFLVEPVDGNAVGDGRIGSDRVSGIGIRRTWRFVHQPSPAGYRFNWHYIQTKRTSPHRIWSRHPETPRPVRPRPPRAD